MAFFEWDSALDVGVAEMNEQHKTLINLMEVLYQKNLASHSKAELIVAIDNLVNYVVKHFHDEESYMASIQFPTLETHKQIHQHLLEDLGKLIEQFKQSDINQLSSEFVMFLKFWLSTHIRGIDTKYGQHR
jgi:hemerythrin-like metal-binding protein